MFNIDVNDREVTVRAPKFKIGWHRVTAGLTAVAMATTISPRRFYLCGFVFMATGR